MRLSASHLSWLNHFLVKIRLVVRFNDKKEKYEDIVTR